MATTALVPHEKMPGFTSKKTDWAGHTWCVTVGAKILPTHCLSYMLRRDLFRGDRKVIRGYECVYFSLCMAGKDFYRVVFRMVHEGGVRVELVFGESEEHWEFHSSTPATQPSLYQKDWEEMRAYLNVPPPVQVTDVLQFLRSKFPDSKGSAV